MMILGAGMSGLIAGAVLRNDCEGIVEAQSSLPANHSAVLRFKTSIVGDTVNIPFKKVQAIKSYVPWKNRIADIMSYSKKTNGDYQLRSIVSADGHVVDRYVAPPDFTQLLSNRLNCEIHFGIKVDRQFILRNGGKKIISTLPMPVLMDLLEYDGPRPEFKSIAGVNIMSVIENCDMQCSLYIPMPDEAPYRISINGNVMISEVALLNVPNGEDFLRPDVQNHRGVKNAVEDWWKQSLFNLGITTSQSTEPTFSVSRYQKILPVDNDMRERFILWASDHFRIFALGRFATWRPQTLLDDLIQDIRVIQRISKNNNYEIRKGVNSI